MKRNFTDFIDDLGDGEKSKVPRGRPEEQDRWLRGGGGDGAAEGSCLVAKSAAEDQGGEDGIRSGGSGIGTGIRIEGVALVVGEKERGEEKEGGEVEDEQGDAALLERIGRNIAAIDGRVHGGLGASGTDRTGKRSSGTSVGVHPADMATSSIMDDYLSEIDALGTHYPGPGLDDEDDVPLSEARFCKAPEVAWTEEMQREMEAASMMPLPDETEDEEDSAKGGEGGRWVFARADQGI